MSALPVSGWLLGKNKRADQEKTMVSPGVDLFLWMVSIFALIDMDAESSVQPMTHFACVSCFL